MESISTKIFKEWYLKLKEAQRRTIVKVGVHFNKDIKRWRKFKEEGYLNLESISRKIFKVEGSWNKKDIKVEGSWRIFKVEEEGYLKEVERRRLFKFGVHFNKDI